jgi:hypothetical protein
MADTRAYRIDLAILARAAQITMANGFNTDLGLQILEGREGVSIESDTFPLLSLIEGEAKVLSRSGSKYEMEMPIIIDAYDQVPKGSNILQHGHALLADIKLGMLPQSALFAGSDALTPLGVDPRSVPPNQVLATEFVFDGYAILSAEADKLVETIVAFKVKWTENVSDPYS